ncbi:MAG TPA: hypothetical protein VER11_16930 [Polyangiaceae bacterium]|nr:hypothetical protein [Polyangiaceae bacterium]
MSDDADHDARCAANPAETSNMKAALSPIVLILQSQLWLIGCGSTADAPEGKGGATSANATAGSGSGVAGQPGAAGGVAIDNPLTNPADGPPAGNGRDTSVPTEAALEDASKPDHVVGNGTKESCTSAAVVAAVAQGGVITFDCGPDPVTIMMEATAKVFNDKPNVVLDGHGLVTLSGMGQRRILYLNTCDQAQVWTSAHCDNQDSPHLTVQNLTFVDGNAKNETNEPAGGAIFVSGGRFKVLNSRFFNNVCADDGPDVGGGALRAFQQFNGLPVYVVNSTFGGAAGLGNVGANGGALSSIGVSWTIIDSVLSDNRAIGDGGNPAKSGTPGGGSGGAIYNDGNKMTLTILGSRIEHNEVNAYGSAVFFVSNDHSGNIVIEDSTITNNVGGSWYPTYPQISNHDDTPIAVKNSVIE